MANEINSVDGGGRAAAGTGSVAQRSSAPTAPAASSGSPESIHITGAASQLAALEQAVRGLPEVDQARVAAVSSSIEQGTYAVSSETVANNLIQLERSLGALGQS
ncbi:MAG TPA: flagellar biosynthesis anti-sigma factor FlgM [Steroidobacteraceae bacterium]|nr:flagellar biosynthesis anti-sigma factor FlgM [Steroidobacteraceae bacterium]